MQDQKCCQDKAIHILLPGFSKVPSGGYKVVYEYANRLAENPANRVTIHQTRAFARDPGLPRLRWVVLRSIKSWSLSIASYRRNRPVPWFSLDKRVTVKNWVGLPRIESDDRSVLVATSVQTARFAANFSLQHQSAAGVYFIQSFEDWAAPRNFVEYTWKLPLHRVVIAPWLQEIGNRLDVTTYLVPNAVDLNKFPKGPPISSRRKLVAGMVSTLPLKRTDLLIAVFEELKQSDPEIEFATFGTCPRPEDLPEWVEHYESPSPEQLISIYQSARVYICVSDLEGWHLPPAEALLSGAAVVSTDIGGVRAYADDSALFSPPGERLGLVRNALHLINNPELAQDRANRGYERLAENSPQTAARQFEDQLDLALRLKHQ